MIVNIIAVAIYKAMIVNIIAVAIYKEYTVA